MTVRIEKQGKVWTVIHSRPEAKNAMDPESAQALESAFLSFDRDPEAAVAVLWGEGGAFCAGFDLKHAARGNGLEEGMRLREAMRAEWTNSLPAFVAEGAAGAARFASGKGRGGSFSDI